MSAVEILENLFFIERGYLNGNHFVYTSDAPVLIDTAYVAHFDQTEQYLAEVGIDQSRVSLIISTHSHCDHIGGNKKIQDRSGCDIAMHRIGKHFIDTRNGWATWWRYFVQEAEFFNCAKSLEDGDTVWVGPHEFQVLYTPGHAADGIVLYHAERKLLISSDTLWENDMAVMTERVEGSRAPFSMLESIEKIEKLDVQIVYPGHGRPFTDFTGSVGRAKERLHGFLQNRKRMGNDLLKKIIVYTLMMKGSMPIETFYEYLMKTPWYPETVDLYFDGDYELKYNTILTDFFNRGIIKSKNGKIFTTVKP
jgi:hydroxyacylglutathione hydrolase